MAELSTLARPYARAAFEFARDVRALDRWSNMLATAANVASTAVMQKFFKSPNYTAEKKGQLFVDVCGDDLDNKVGNFLKHLAKNNRLPLLAEVQALFELYKANEEKAIDVDISAAFEISPEQQSKLASALKAKLDRDINLNTNVDKNLLGGVVIRAGDLVIDGSIRGRLAKLAESMQVSV
jgi:F-type H+-transporting ATPase subunit delta